MVNTLKIKASTRKDNHLTLSNTRNTRTLAKLSHFKIFSYSSLIEELPSPTLRILICNTFAHIENSIKGKKNFLQIQ